MSPALADLSAALGNQVTSDTVGSAYNYAIEIDTSGNIDVYGAMQPRYEIMTTNDTIEATESGKTFIFTSGATRALATFKLPAAADGLNYKFVCGVSTGIYIDPQDGDQIFYSTNVAGDRVLNTSQASGDSIELIGDDSDNAWYAIPIVGTWSDVN